MKILYIPTLNQAITHWRIENYAVEMLKLHPGVKVHVHYMENCYPDLAWDKLILNNGKISKTIQEAVESAFKFFDVLIIQKVQYKEGITFLSNMKKKYPKTLMIAEIDDSVGHVDPSNPQYLKFAEHHKWAAQHCLMSDGIITSTSYLGKSLSDFNDTVYVAPNFINPTTWETEKAKKSKETKIAYVAGGGHDKDLQIAYRGIIPVLKKNPDLRLVIRYGGLRPDWLLYNSQVDFKRVNWPIASYSKNMSKIGAHLGIAPLRDTVFNRCKSNIKWIEWASMGVPVLASRVEPYEKTRGPIHLVSNDPKEWEGYLTGLLPLIREHKVDKSLIETNLERYDITREVQNLVEWLKSLT
jgi:glycosyltransferase involved in cell wall biosynthesis